MSATLTVQPSALCFAAPVTLATADAAQPAKERRFEGVAYGGGLITDHSAWAAVGFDLAGLQASAPMPLLLQHDSERVIGVIDQVTNDGRQLRIGGRLFTGIEPAAASVAAKADAGAPWQMSVGIWPDSVEEVPAGSPLTLNQTSHTGPAHVFRRSRVREVSFVALGADASTSASVFNRHAGPVALSLSPPGEPNMADPTVAELQAQLAAEKTRADKAEADLKTERERFAAEQRAKREAEVKALLGDEFSAEKAAPYLDMTPVQFAAVKAQLESVRSKLPPGFTAEQATAGANPDALAASPLLASARQMFNIRAA